MELDFTSRLRINNSAADSFAWPDRRLAVWPFGWLVSQLPRHIHRDASSVCWLVALGYAATNRAPLDFNIIHFHFHIIFTSTAGV